MTSATWKWLIEAPLTAVWRKRLEMALAVTLTGAAVVAMASVVRPDPERVAELQGLHPLVSSPPTPMLPGDELPKAISPEFADAVKAGNVNAMRQTYQRNMRLDGMLSLAAKSGKEESVRWLLSIGANVHDEEYSPAGPVLASDAYPSITKLLIAKGARKPTLEMACSVNAINTFNRMVAETPLEAKTPAVLHAAAGATAGTAANKRAMVTKLLELGADPNATFGGETPLAMAVRVCSVPVPESDVQASCMSIVQLLLDHGAKVTGDALGAALSLDDSDRAAPLETLLARPIEKGVTSTALSNASSVSPADLKRLVKMGVDWNWHDGEEDASAPLQAAVRRNDRDLARQLIEAGAPVDVHFKDGSCALADAIDAQNNPEAARIVELLVTKGASVNRRFPDGRSPLYAAAEAGDIRVVNFLIARGANVNEVVLDKTPLDAAEMHSNIAAARILHAHGGRRVKPNGWRE